MADVYKVGVSILLTSNAAGVLGALAKGLTGINNQVTNLATNWGKTALVIKGAAGIMAGVGIVKGMADIAKHGEKLLDQQDKLIRAGRTRAEVESLTADAFGRITKEVPTATASDVLRAVNELTMVTGDFNKARAAAAQSLKMEALISNATGKSAEGQGYDIWRAIEMKGDSMDPAKADAVMGKITAMVIASAGKISGSQVKNFAQQAGSGWSNANDHALGGSIPYMINEMGGERAGTGWLRMTNAIQATRRWTHQQYDAWKKLGLIDKSNVLGGDLGGQLNFKPGASPIKGGMANLGDMADEIANVIRPAFLKAGITDPKLADSWLAKMFPDSVAAKFAQRLYRQADNIEKDRKNIDAARPLTPAYADLTSNNPKGVMEAYHQQMDSMLSAMGGPLMQAAIPVMKALTNVFNEIGAFSAVHPEAIKNVGIGLGILAAALTGAGIVALAAAFGTGGAIAGIVTGAAALVAYNWDGFLTVGKKINDAMDGLAKGINSAIDSAASLLGLAAGKLAQAIIDIGKRALAAIGIGGGGGDAAGHGPGATAKGMSHSRGFKAGISHAAPISYWGHPPSSGGGVGGAIQIHNYIDGQKIKGHMVKTIVADASGPLQGATYYDQTHGIGASDGRTALG